MAGAIERDPTRAHAPPPAPPVAAAGWKPADPGPLGLAAFAMTTFMLSSTPARAQKFRQDAIDQKME